LLARSQRLRGRLAVVQGAIGKGEIAICALHDSTVEGLDPEED
jgi:hypothetical protein